MDVSIVIPMHNSSRTVTKTLDGCRRQALSDGEKEIVLVDDGSRERIHKSLTEGINYIYQKNAGPAAARNTGWKSSSGEIICFTDADCVPEDGWVRAHRAHYTSDEIAGVGGSYDIMNPESFLARCIHQEILLRHSRIPEDADFLGSFNVSYRRRVLEEVGGFDETFKRASGEDNELAYKIKKKGYRLIFDKNIKVGHYHPDNVFRYLKSQFWHGFWRMKLYRLHPDMAGGDSYAGLLDFIWPPMAVFLLVAVPFLGVHWIKNLFLGFFLLGIFIQFPLTAGVVLRTGDYRYLNLAVLTFLRGFPRGVGMTAGLCRFFIFERRRSKSSL